MMIRFAKLASSVALASAMMTLSGAALAADPIKIGVSGPFTGGSSSMGVSMRDGVRLATDEINKAGGVLGRQLQLIERDDEAKNERGVQIAQELINKEKVVATVAGLAALLPGSQDSGDEQRGHRLPCHAPV
jgi:branched-chain amino acid transport system substrate-binding protein